MEQGKFRISDFGFRIEKINPKSETLNLGPQSAFGIPKSAIELLHYSKDFELDTVSRTINEVTADS